MDSLDGKFEDSFGIDYMILNVDAPPYFIAEFTYNRFIIGLENGNVQIWNLNDSSLLKTFSAFDSELFSIIVLKNGFIAISSYSLKIWNENENSIVFTSEELDSDIYSLVELKNGFLAGATYESIIIWDLENKNVFAELKVPDYWVYVLTILSNENLASVSEDGIIRIWNPLEKKLV
jgi:WD40 repeat protein